MRDAGVSSWKQCCANERDRTLFGILMCWKHAWYPWNLASLKGVACSSMLRAERTCCLEDVEVKLLTKSHIYQGKFILAIQSVFHIWCQMTGTFRSWIWCLRLFCRKKKRRESKSIVPLYLAARVYYPLVLLLCLYWRVIFISFHILHCYRQA